MKPETLKLIAEALGYTTTLNASIGGAEFVPVAIRLQDGYHEFNPTNNAEQREEILLWLASDGWKYYMLNDRHVFRKYKPSELSADKDYTTALMKAAESQVNKVKGV